MGRLFGTDGAVGVANVEIGRGIVDGGGNVVITLALVAHDINPPNQM